MKSKIIIDEYNETISTKDDAILALSFYTNKKIQYLPVKVAESFPNLIAYGADNTSVKEISKENFKGLTKLRTLGLIGTEIEKIYSDTFEDLVNVEVLWLGN